MAHLGIVRETKCGLWIGKYVIFIERGEAGKGENTVFREKEKEGGKSDQTFTERSRRSYECSPYYYSLHDISDVIEACGGSRGLGNTEVSNTGLVHLEHWSGQVWQGRHSG